MQADHGIKQATLDAADTIEELTTTVLNNIGERKTKSMAARLTTCMRLATLLTHTCLR